MELEKIPLTAKNKIIAIDVIASSRKAPAFGPGSGADCEVVLARLRADDDKKFVAFFASAEFESFPMEDATRQYGVVTHALSRNNSLRYSNSAASIVDVSFIRPSVLRIRSREVTLPVSFPPL